MLAACHQMLTILTGERGEHKDGPRSFRCASSKGIKHRWRLISVTSMRRADC
jgi:hypothetical protein